MYTHGGVCRGSAAVPGDDYSWTGAAWTGPVAGGGDGDSMGPGTRGDLARGCPEFSPQALWTVRAVINNTRREDGKTTLKCFSKRIKFLTRVPSYLVLYLLVRTSAEL